MPDREQSATAIFGADADWGDVYTYALSYLERAYLHAPNNVRQDVPDAVGEAIVLAMEKWVTWRGSVLPDDPAKTLAGAKRFVVLTAKEWLSNGGNTPNDEILVGVRWEDEDELVEVAEQVIEEMSTDEWESWGRDMLEDSLTERESAELQGVSQPAIHKRRVNGIGRARNRLLELI